MAGEEQRGETHLSTGLVWLLAVACGAMAANLYYAQTLIDGIGPEIGLDPTVAGLITTLTQLGYGVGLLLIVPLADLVENRRLAIAASLGAGVGCLAIAFSQNAATFLLASAVTGLCSTGAQVLVPLASHLARPERQGHVVGLVMSGLLGGIMLARPVASYTAHLLGWRAVFFGSAGIMLAIALALLAACPQRRPDARITYRALVASVFGQVRKHRTLQLRAAYQGLLFASFNLFWTAAPLLLIHRYGFTQQGIALFAFAAAGGALVAPQAGRMADRGHGWRSTLAALATVVVAFLAADWAVAAGSLLAFVVVAVVLDAATQVNHVTGQRIIFGLSQDARGRINSAYMTVMFLFGAFGSVIGSATYAAGGWQFSALAGAGLGAVALALFLAFDRGASRTG
jgi:predicted MFS family arabinose efflux permease